jgi:DNA-binding transcriptional ArsR family regulator
MSITEPPVTPGSIEKLACVLAHYDRGEVSTHGKIVKETGKGKRAVSESLRRLEEDGWITRPPYRSGCVRAIRLKPSRIVKSRRLVKAWHRPKQD